jgi:hypothetical protein
VITVTTSASFQRHVLDGLRVPVLPCVGNHENRQGEGVAELNAAYDACMAPAGTTTSTPLAASLLLSSIPVVPIGPLMR